MSDETEIVDGLTRAEQAANYVTFRHIEKVRDLIGLVIIELLRRAAQHDQSKLVPPEVAGFAANNHKLPGSTYDSVEYRKTKGEGTLAKALAHHYAKNRHHPEHHADGVNDMNLLDVLEMFLDWKASSERHVDGNILKSIKVNADRFGLSPQLTRILENTAKLFDAATR